MNSLAQLVESTESLATTFRNTNIGWQPYVFEVEYTNWMEEQRAVRDSVAVVDQSYHMEILDIEGPDAVDLLERLGVNSFENVRTGDPPLAKNYLTCNPDGYVIGDVIVFYLADEKFLSVGSEWINNWVRYHAETGPEDVTTRVPYHPFDDHDPPHFRFQIQGPDALETMDAVIDGGEPDISFFEIDTVRIEGVETYALGHGMAATPGLEIFGPYAHHDTVLDRIFAAGEDYSIRQLGTKAYKTGKIGSGWFVAAVPAIYDHDELAGYREWLGADSMEASFSIGGSFESEDITDYYMTPYEQGKGHLIEFEHDFVGADALKEMSTQPHRERVTLVWNPADVQTVYGSLFEDGPTHKYIDMPDVATQWSVSHYDTILKDGEMVGLSKYPGYLAYEREMLSIATIDPEFSDPGTEVTFIWGDTSEKQRVERHEPIEIRATVAESPYVHGGRRSM